jgi:CBS domain containing-hemolysin-like protein
MGSCNATQLPTLTVVFHTPTVLLASWTDTLLQNTEVLLLALCALVVSVLVSAFEVAFLNQADALTEPPRENAHTRFFRKRPQSLWATVLVSNNLSNIAFLILAAHISGEFRHAAGWIGWPWRMAEIVLLILFVVVFGEMLPKAYAQYRPKGFVARYAAFMRVLYYVTYPFSILVERLARRHTEDKPAETELTYRELRHAIEIASDDDSPAEEKRILRGLVDLSSSTVRQVMRPREEMRTLSHRMTADEAVAEIREAGYSRMPVVITGPDNVVGILHAKDVLGVVGTPEARSWQRRVRTPFFVLPETKVNKLLAEMRLKRQHLALVRDETGRTIGLITIQDILDEIFGELHDEFDRPEVLYVREQDESVLLDGRLPVADFCRLMGLNGISRTPGQTVSAFLQQLTQRPLRVGQSIVFQNLVFELLAVTAGEVRQLRARTTTLPRPTPA